MWSLCSTEVTSLLAAEGENTAYVIYFILNGYSQVRWIPTFDSLVHDWFQGAVVRWAEVCVCEQQPMHYFLALYVSRWKSTLQPVILASAAKWERSRDSANLTWEVLQIFVAVWSPPAATQACDSWRGWPWCSTAAGEARVMWMKTLSWKRISLNPKGHPAFLSKVVDVLQELWVMAETCFAFGSSGSQLGVLAE